MADRYVRTTGSDANGGTGPSDAWLTIGKAMTSCSAGDVIYVGAGHYRVSATIAPTSMASMTYVVGDVDGAKTGDPGEVVVSNYGTNDTTAPAGVYPFTFASKNNWTLRRLTILSGGTTPANAACINISGSSAFLTFQDCLFEAAVYDVYMSGVTFGTVQTIIFERCWAFGAYFIAWELPGSGSGSGDINIASAVRNCVLVTSGDTFLFNTTAGTARKTGGITIANVWTTTGNYVAYTAATNISTTYPINFYNSLLQSAYQGLYSSLAGPPYQFVEDYNIIIAKDGARVNVAAGANSKADYSRNWRFSMGHESSFGAPTRPFGEFPAGSPLLAWGGTSVPTDDITGITRPASGAGQSSTQDALGPFERSRSWTKETTTVRTGTTALRCAGPGYQDFELPVDSVSTTVGIYMRFDASYAGTKPSMSVLNGGECGVADATATMAGGADTWELVSLTFTPTARGIVTIRLLSSSTAAAGNAYADDFSVS